ncbi:MAG: hypothetical protein HFJ46_01720 [Clostridia bacterium]|jgi:transcriptional regulator with XRE-family HTH domain|nr:hypothetical protein [Clostridia bacterium]
MKKRENRNFYTLGELIYLSRIRKGISRQNLANIFDKDNIEEKDVSLKGVIKYNKITEKTIKKWETDLNYPNIEIIYKLSQYLDADPTEFLKAKQSVQKYSVNGIAMKIVGLICYAFDIASRNLGFYNKIVSTAIRLIIAMVALRMIYVFVGH